MSQKPASAESLEGKLDKLERGLWRVVHAFVTPTMLVLAGFWIGARVSAEGSDPYSWVVTWAFFNIFFDILGDYFLYAMAITILFSLARRIARFFH